MLDYEIGQLEKLETWDVIDLHQGHTVIPSSEVIKVKRGPNGETLSYQVRIIAGGHRQIKGINYTETFSAAAKMPTVRVVLANAAHQDWEIEHIDVKSAYLNAKLKEIIYMKPPRGVLKKGHVRGRLMQCESLRGEFERKPVIPSLLKSWGPKATSCYLYIRVVTTTHDNGNYQHMQTIHRTSKKVKEHLRSTRR